VTWVAANERHDCGACLEPILPGDAMTLVDDDWRHPRCAELEDS
jgi:hypothetical protein